MKRLNLDGFYSYQGIETNRLKLIGKIEVKDNNSFEGKIYDDSSKFLRQLIKGHLKNENGLIRLVFIRFPPFGRLADSAYNLSKSKEENFAGLYKGKWNTILYRREFDENYEIFMTRLNNDENIQNYVELTLSEK